MLKNMKYRFEMLKRINANTSLKLHVVLLSLCKLTLLLVTIIRPFFYYVLINGVFVKKSLNLLLIVIVGYVISYIFESVVYLIERKRQNKLRIMLDIKLKRSLLSVLASMEVSALESYNLGDLKNRFIDDTQTFYRFVVSHIIEYSYHLITMIVIVILLIRINLLLSILSLSLIPFSLLFTNVVGRKVGYYSDKVRTMYGDYESYIYNSLSGWKDIKSYQIEEEQVNRLQLIWDDLTTALVKRQIFWSINRAFIEFKDLFLTNMLLYFVGGLFIIYERIDIAALLVFLNYYQKLYNSFSAMSNYELEINKDKIQLERVFEIITIEKQEYGVQTCNGTDLVIKNLSYKYSDSSKFQLSIDSLSIKQGENVVIVGESGSGKTTLVKLLTGILLPDDGTITIGGVDVNKMNREYFYQQINIVQQNNKFFNTTVKDNMLIVDSKLSDTQILNILSKVEIQKDNMTLNELLQCEMGEGGSNFSGGELQRLSIVRTLLKDPNIFIFDESTSNLDSVNEEIVIGLINKVCDEKTVINIAHKLSIIKRSDRIILLENGSVVGDGSFNELFKNNNAIRSLFSHQVNLEEFNENIRFVN